eukprot:1520165-Rhodomonas_salina.2
MGPGPSMTPPHPPMLSLKAHSAITVAASHVHWQVLEEAHFLVILECLLDDWTGYDSATRNSMVPNLKAQLVSGNMHLVPEAQISHVLCRLVEAWTIIHLPPASQGAHAEFQHKAAVQKHRQQH